MMHLSIKMVDFLENMRYDLSALKGDMALSLDRRNGNRIYTSFVSGTGRNNEILEGRRDA